MENSMVCLDDFEEHAVRVLDKGVLGYYQSGADDQISLKDNKEAFKRWKLMPRMLRNVSSRDMATTILGHPISFPVGVAPSAYQSEAHHEGEIATARAVFEMNTCYTMSTFSTKSFEEVSSSSPRVLRFFQLYIFKDRDLTKQLIRRAERAGFSAVVLTVDTPFTGKRRLDLRTGFIPQVTSANYPDSMNDCVHGHTAGLLDPSLTWNDIEFVKSCTNLPIVLKGILTAEDAKIAVESGAAGVWVSNHGGRQLDTVPATIDVLPEIVAAIGSKCEVYLDGGIRLGSDVFKALALGARAVFIGRPVLYGLAYDGSEGVKKVLQILREELDCAMALAGCSNLGEVTQSLVRHQSSFPAKL